MVTLDKLGDLKPPHLPQEPFNRSTAYLATGETEGTYRSFYSVEV